MKRWFTIPVLLVTALMLAAAGLADPGDHGKGKKQGKNRFTFMLTNTDQRCDGSGAWANLQEKRTYVVHDNGNGTFRLRRVSRGTFTTLLGTSPGNCAANKSRHGQTVRAGVTGRFGGFLEGTIRRRSASTPVSRATSSRRSSAVVRRSRVTQPAAPTASSTSTTPRRRARPTARRRSSSSAIGRTVVRAPGHSSTRCSTATLRAPDALDKPG
jgi:hypothetical protein